MSSKNRRSGGAGTLARQRRAGALSALTLAAVVGLSGLGSPAQAAFPGTNGRLACEGTRGVEPSVEVYTINPDGTGEMVLTENAVRDGDPGWSPDGAFITFESFRDTVSEVYKMGAPVELWVKFIAGGRW